MIAALFLFGIFASCAYGQSVDSLLHRLDLVEQELHGSLKHLGDSSAALDELAAQIQALTGSLQGFNLEAASGLYEAVSVQVEEYKDYVEYMNVPIAFSASAATAQSVGDGGTIIFGDVITNIGLNYNPTTSEFLAPYTGLYVFTTTLYASTSNMYGGTIMVGSTPQVQAYACDPLRDDQSTAVVMAIVNQGDLVYVQATDVVGQLDGSAVDRLSTFSGFFVLML